MTVTREAVSPAVGLHQPYDYVRTELVEPDWRRFPGWHDVSEKQWRDAQWQREHRVRDLPPVLRALHADGPRGQLDRAGHQTQAGTQAGRPPGRDHRLP